MSSSNDTAVIALERATQAMERIDKHELLCAKRYDGIAKTQLNITEKLDAIKSDTFKQWLVVAGTSITILLGTIGFLFAKLNGWV
jgi:hypothetical protein